MPAAKFERSLLADAIRLMSADAGIDEKGVIRLNPRAIEPMMGYGIGWSDPECDEPLTAVLMSPYQVESALPVFTLTKPSKMKDQIKALGNSLVPHCAARLFDRILDMEA